MSVMSDLNTQIEEWVKWRVELTNREDSGDYPNADDWAENDDEAARLLVMVAETLGFGVTE